MSSPNGGPPPITLVAHDVGAIGGMERHLTELVRGLLGAGHEVTVISRSCELAEHERLKWVRVPGPARPFPLAYLSFLAVGSFLLRRYRRGVVHTTGAIVLGRTDLSTVHLCHHAVAERKGLRRSRRASVWYALNARLAAIMSRIGERFLYRPSRVSRLVAVSRGVAAELARHFPRMSARVTTIPNGVDSARFRPEAESRRETRRRLGLDDGELAALFVGGEWEGKGLRFALEAVAQTDGWRLLVVGDGDHARYGRLAEQLGLGDRISFLGATSDLAPLYRAADAFVLPTAYESFSLVTYEAAASGLPLLVTAVSGVEEILREGENGWFIERRADAIAPRLSRLAEDADLRRSMSLAAREATGGFTWETMVESYRGLYGRVGGAT